MITVKKWTERWCCKTFIQALKTGHVMFSVEGSGARPRDTFVVDIAYARREESTGLNTRYCGLLL